MAKRRRSGKGGDRGSELPLPRARREGILVMDVADEVVVYDRGEFRGHCLNRTAAAVWRHLDGRTTMSGMLARLRTELDGPVDEDVVWLALRELDRARLLEERLDGPDPRAISRRKVLRRLGVAAGGGAVLLPAISSMVAPPVHAQVSASACGTPETNCQTVSCPGLCACVPTTEATIVCVQPTCTFATPCSSSSGCGPGQVCITLPCCGPTLPFCAPIAPAGFTCFAPVPPGPAPARPPIWQR